MFIIKFLVYMLFAISHSKPSKYRRKTRSLKKLDKYDRLHTPAHYGHHHHHLVARADLIPNWNMHDLYHEIHFNLNKREPRDLEFNNLWGDSQIEKIRNMPKDDKVWTKIAMFG